MEIEELRARKTCSIRLIKPLNIGKSIIDWLLITWLLKTSGLLSIVSHRNASLINCFVLVKDHNSCVSRRKISGSTYCRRICIRVRRFTSVTFARRRKKKRRIRSARISPRNFVLIYWKLTLKTFRHQMMQTAIRITFSDQIRQKSERKMFT